MRISCIIPTCDRPDMLAQSLASVFSQTRLPDEVIVADNGRSPAPIPSEYIERVHMLSLPPRVGVSVARNMGAKAASGDILAFLDDDDLWSPDYLRQIGMAFENGVACTISRLDALRDGHIVAYKNAAGLLTLEDLFTFNPGVTGSNIAILKSTFLTVGGFDEHLTTGEDKSLIIELLTTGTAVMALPDNQTIHREHTGERLTDPASMAEGIRRFTEKYRERMSRKAFFFNRRKYFRARVEAGAKTAYVGLVTYALLYRMSTHAHATA